MANITLAEFISDLEMAAIAALGSFAAALSVGVTDTKSFESAGIAAAIAGIYAFAKATGLSSPSITPTPIPAKAATQVVTVTRTETPIIPKAGS